MVYKGTVWNLKTRIRYDQDNPGLSVKIYFMFVDACILVSTVSDESPAGFHLHIQPSLHTAHLHVFMKMTIHVRLCCGQFQLQRNIQHKNWTDGLLYIYLYAHVFTYVHYAFSIQYKLQEKSNTITCTCKIYDLWLCEGGKSTMLHPWQDIFQKLKGLFCDNDQLTVHYLA